MKSPRLCLIGSSQQVVSDPKVRNDLTVIGSIRDREYRRGTLTWGGDCWVPKYESKSQIG